MKIFKDTFLLILLIFYGCQAPQADHGEGKSVFRYNESSGISSLDPAFARDQASIWAVHQLYGGLVEMNDALEPMPSIAKSWEIKENGLLYVFHLRQDVYFHNDGAFAGGKGRKVVAEDFVYSFKRIMDPTIASPGSWVFNTVDPTKNFNAPNDSTLEIYLKNSFPPFLGILSMQYCDVVPREALEKYGSDFRSHPVGSGPFIFKMWQEGVHLVFLKNPNYFEFENGSRLPHLDAILISFLGDKQSAFLEFIQGKLDFLSGIDASYKDELLTPDGKLKPKYAGKFKMDVKPYLNTEYLGILSDAKLSQVEKSPLKIKEIRQAINYCIDRKKMIEYLRNNIGIASEAGMVPPGLPSYDKEQVAGYTYSIKKASALLSKAGYPSGKGLPEITLYTTSNYVDLCEFIQNQLGLLGIKIKLESNQAAQHREMVAHSKLNFFRASWVADYPDAENYLALFYSKNFTPGGPNYTRFSNPKFDQLYETSLKETDMQKRKKFYIEMDNIIMEEAPVVVLYYDQSVRLSQNNITHLGNNGMNLLNLKRVIK